MKRLVILLLMLLLALPALAEDAAPIIIDRTGNLVEEYKFPEDTPIL